jgi:ribosomal-protein-serine acetyltransferase
MTQLPAAVTTERLTLRWWEVADAPALARAVTDSLDHLLPWMPWAAFEPTSIDARAALIERWRADAESGGDVVYGVFLGAAPIGGTGFHRRRGPGTLEIGYWIHVDHTGRGYATELARALTSTAFTVGGIDHVEIHHDRANAASGAVPRSLGYRLVSEQRRPVEAPGECGIDCGWRIDRDQWIAAR